MPSINLRRNGEHFTVPQETLHEVYQDVLDNHSIIHFENAKRFFYLSCAKHKSGKPMFIAGFRKPRGSQTLHWYPFPADPLPAGYHTAETLRKGEFELRYIRNSDVGCLWFVQDSCESVLHPRKTLIKGKIMGEIWAENFCKWEQEGDVWSYSVHGKSIKTMGNAPAWKLVLSSSQFSC